MSDEVTPAGPLDEAEHSTVDTLDASPAEREREAAPPPPTRRRRRFDRGLFVASFVIACGLALIVFGFTVALTGDDGIDRPDAIESIQPVESAVQVLQQDRIVVDFEAGYEARLIVDGVEIPTTEIGQSDVDPALTVEPGQQVDLPTTAVWDPGNAVISFQPVEGAAIESFTQGTHEVTVVYWSIEDGPEQARLYTWEFEVV